ncbi:MAG: hypothetical protein H6737_10295 [Alphaproteobacteria bacterium]|nr:hypothetical protein [Alphaproteobacteria bacterium]
MNGLREDGHLTDLALEYALDGAPLDATRAHLDTCGVCRARLEAARDIELPAMPELAAPTAPVLQTPEPANRPWMWAVWLAAAAVAALVAVPLLRPADDGLRVKGAGLSLQVYRDEGETSARLKDGDPIAPGDRLGFRVRNRDAGYLMVLGIDSADAPYLCYPQHGGGSAEEVGESPRPRPLPEAIRMDDTPGTERIVAVLCEGPFDFETMADAVSEDDLPAGCTMDGLTLEKR